MKRTLLIVAIVSLFVVSALSAQMRDFSGKSWVSGNLGYAVGTGDAFASYSEPITNMKLSTGAGLGFGGQYYYGVKKNFLIGGEVMFQRYTVELSAPPNLALNFDGIDIKESTTETNVIVNALYGVKQTSKSDFFLMGGTGLYDFGGFEFGLNTGLFWRYQVSPSVHLFGMPRVHVVFSDATPIMYQFTMGAQLSL